MWLLSHDIYIMIQEREDFIALLKDKAYRRGDFTLSSGKKSEHYVNCKPVTLSSRGLTLASLILLSSVEEDVKAELKKTDKDVVELETKGYDYKDPKNLDNVYGESFLQGYYTELKNPKNVDLTEAELKEIVAKNLESNRLYYTEEAQFGIEGIGYTDEAPGLAASKSVESISSSDICT